MINRRKSLLCSLLGHKTITKQEFYPHILAEIITEYKFTSTCTRCGFKHVTHQIWDENNKDFKDANAI